MEMSRLTRDGTAEPVSRDQILRRERGQGKNHFLCPGDHEQAPAAQGGKMNPQMNATFRGAAAQYISKQHPITHRQEVCRLYRNALKLLDSWAIDRTVFNTEATAIRKMFDEGSGCEPGGARATALVRDAQKKMEKYVHVDRYIRPYMPSGSSFMRNPPPPLEACYPLGIPDSVLEEFKSIPKEVEVDMSKPEDGRMSRAGQVLVDLATKRVY